MRHETPSAGTFEVSLLSITQATAATFSDLFIRLAFLCFIRSGSKRVVCPVNGEMIGGEGDLLVFPPGTMVTLENRPVPNAAYGADGVFFSHDLVEAVFGDIRPRREAPGVQILRAGPRGPAEMLALVRETLGNEALPPSIRRHRLMEPLIWLREEGIRLPARPDDQPLHRLRDLIETDPGRPWRAADAARSFAMSEATFRRWLAGSGQGFSAILRNTRLERGLTLLQTTDSPVSRIALDCGFKTPSHFSDAFRQRFGIQPRAIRCSTELIVSR